MKPSRIFKKIMKSDGIHAVACWLIAQYLKIVYLTSRWEFVGFEKQRKFIDEGKPFLILLWHGRIAMTAYAWDSGKKPISVLASGHRDGQFVSGTLSHFNVGSVVGSSKKGAVAATKAVVRKMKQGHTIAMSPDGPRGPRMRMKEGPIVIARLADARITFITYSVKHRIIFNSWDRFCLPLPFNKGIFLWGDQSDLPDYGNVTDIQQLKVMLENHLTEMTNSADRIMGHAPIHPAAVPVEDSARP